jgi:hypothetical protein
MAELGSARTVNFLDSEHFRNFLVRINSNIYLIFSSRPALSQQGFKPVLQWCEVKSRVSCFFTTIKIIFLILLIIVKIRFSNEHQKKENTIFKRRYNYHEFINEYGSKQLSKRSQFLPNRLLGKFKRDGDYI